jgi:alkylation response protein AidB-like acyl-CoA dehydrogenase
MTFAPTADHHELRNVVRKFFTTTGGVERARAGIDEPAPTGANTIWRRQVDELELSGLAVAEEFGGQGFGPYEVALVCEEAGRQLAGGPFLSTVGFAASAISLVGGDADRSRLLPALVAGETAAWAHRDARSSSTVATALDDSAYTLTGGKIDVLGGDDAQLLVITARTAHGPELFAVKADSPGIERISHPVVDGSRNLVDLTFDDTPATAIGTAGGDGIERALDTTRVYLAAEAIGSADQCLADVLEHVKTRTQFGRQVGGFQALQHRCADLLVQIELARTAVQYAARALTHQPGQVPLATSLASAAAMGAFDSAVTENIQLHGGIGVTWEAAPHLYARRQAVVETLLGTPAWHRRRIAQIIEASTS